MKTIFLFASVGLLLLACSERKESNVNKTDNTDNTGTTGNMENGTTGSDQRVKEHSGENISPQVESKGDRLIVDTISSAQDAEKEKQTDDLKK